MDETCEDDFSTRFGEGFQSRAGLAGSKGLLRFRSHRALAGMTPASITKSGIIAPTDVVNYVLAAHPQTGTAGAVQRSVTPGAAWLVL